MKNYVILSIYFFIFFCFFLTIKRNVTFSYTLHPSSYIIAECDGGLANRLRALLAYIFIAQSVHDNAELFMIWDINNACPGHFLQIFQPITGVTFITSEARDVLSINASAVYRNSRDDFWVTIIKAVNKTGFSDRKGGFYKHHQERLFKLFRPLKEIQSHMEEYVKKNQICNSIAIHIRRTDLWAELHHKRRTAYSAFYRFIDRFPSETKVYLMTDNPMTQASFIDKYGPEKLLIYNDMKKKPYLPKISDENMMIQEVPKLDENASISTEYRYTTIEHTLIDTLIAAHAKEFQHSPFSSLSELVISFHWNYRWRWCKYCIDDGSCK